MKHLVQSTLYGSKVRRFNEEFNNIENRIQDLCDGRLAYLIDEGYKINYYIEGRFWFSNDYIIDIGLIAQKGCPSKYLFTRYEDDKKYRKFSWNSVKDYVIPLLKQLNGDYNIEVEIYGIPKTNATYKDKHIPDYKGIVYDLDWIINDEPSKFFTSNSIKWIKIKVKKYLMKKDAK